MYHNFVGYFVMTVKFYTAAVIVAISALVPVAFLLSCGSCGGVLLYIIYRKKTKHLQGSIYLLIIVLSY